MKRKVIGIWLFLCLAVPITATFTYFHFQKKGIRKEIKRKLIAGLDPSELVLLKLTHEDQIKYLRWEHPGEFEYQQNMYDVVNSEVRGDTTWFWCWQDHRETRINRLLDELVASALGKESPQNETQQHLVNFYKSIYFQNTFIWQFFPAPKEKPGIHYLFSCLTISFPPSLPPPEYG